VSKVSVLSGPERRHRKKEKAGLGEGLPEPLASRNSVLPSGTARYADHINHEALLMVCVLWSWVSLFKLGHCQIHIRPLKQAFTR
jgi:hypothetical protein